MASIHKDFKAGPVLPRAHPAPARVTRVSVRQLPRLVHESIERAQTATGTHLTLLCCSELAFGRIPRKAPHESAAATTRDGCSTRSASRARASRGRTRFLYHRARPQAVRDQGTAAEAAPALSGHIPDKLARRHYRSLSTPAGKVPFDSALAAALQRRSGDRGVAQPTAADQTYVSNGDGDELIFVFEGSVDRPVDSRGSALREERLHPAAAGRDQPDGARRAGPTALVHRMEFRRGVGIPSRVANSRRTRLRMDARPTVTATSACAEFKGPMDEGIRGLTVKKGDRFHAFQVRRSAAGCRRLGRRRLSDRVSDSQVSAARGLGPPAAHLAQEPSPAAARSVQLRASARSTSTRRPSRVPIRTRDVDVDEVIFYCSGNFTSRRGVGPSSVSFPSGRRRAWAPSRRLREEHRSQVDRGARGDAGLLQAAQADGVRAGGRGSGVPGETSGTKTIKRSGSRAHGRGETIALRLQVADKRCALMRFSAPVASDPTVSPPAYLGDDSILGIPARQ